MAKSVKKIYEWLFYLIDNTITPEQGDKIAKMKSKKTKRIEDIADLIVKERTEYRKDTIVNILKLANEAKMTFFSMGEMVNDGMVIFEPTITGNFYENTDFVDGRNECVINTRVTNDVHNLTAQVKGTYNGLTVENGGAAIDGIVDSATGLTTGKITPGKTVTITGKKIRIVPEEGESIPDCITFTNVATQQVIVQSDALTSNDPSKLVLQLPMLPVGAYTLTIKTKHSTTSTTLKEPRYITFKTKLIVE